MSRPAVPSAVWEPPACKFGLPPSLVLIPGYRPKVNPIFKPSCTVAPDTVSAAGSRPLLTDEELSEDEDVQAKGWFVGCSWKPLLEAEGVQRACQNGDHAPSSCCAGDTTFSGRQSCSILRYGTAQSCHAHGTPPCRADHARDQTCRDPLKTPYLSHC